MSRRPRRYYFNGPRFRELRIARKLSLSQLSGMLWRCDVEAYGETIRKWEIGASEPRVSQLYTACRILQISPAQVMLDGRPPGGEPE